MRNTVVVMQLDLFFHLSYPIGMTPAAEILTKNEVNHYIKLQETHNKLQFKSCCISSVAMSSSQTSCSSPLIKHMIKTQHMAYTVLSY